VELARAQVGDSRSIAVAAGAPVARLRIPRIGLDAIVLEGVEDSELNAGPGHLPGSALPGEPGNAVISAHRDRHFSRLGELQVGDTITTETGQSVAWVIVRRRVVGEAAPALFSTPDATLTLTTCWPIRYLGTAPDRLLLTARPITASGGPALQTAEGRRRG
jgi:sortase A